MEQGRKADEECMVVPTAIVGRYYMALVTMAQTLTKGTFWVHRSLL